jgi:vacuolar-type H+-ATPase subunit I/STV1
MAKGKSKKPAKVDDPQAVASGEVAKKASLPRGVRKHLRELESQLADAASMEQKRQKKLEKSRQRRQSIGSALDKLRGRTAITAAPAPAPAPATSEPTTTD